MLALTISLVIFDAVSILIEIRSGEGGDDSKNFVFELAQIYLKYAKRKSLSCKILETSNSSMSILASGKDVKRAFENESGKHVVQRCPPNERGSRRHTSMVTVAVLPILRIPKEKLRDADLEEIFQRGGGPGGQHRNKTSSAVRMKHKPTGLSVFIDEERDQTRNRKRALEILTAKVNHQKESQIKSNYNSNKKEQLGSGSRGDEKTRTYNFFESIVVDHKQSKRTNMIKEVMKGNLDLLK